MRKSNSKWKIGHQCRKIAYQCWVNASQPCDLLFYICLKGANQFILMSKMPQAKENPKHKQPSVDEQNEPYLRIVHKKIRNINKRLTQIAQLEQKENLKLEQVDKINRKAQLLEGRTRLEDTVAFLKQSYLENAELFRAHQLKELQILSRALAVFFTHPQFSQHPKLNKLWTGLQEIQGATLNDAIADISSVLKEAANDVKFQKALSTFVAEQGQKALEKKVATGQTHTDQIIIFKENIFNQRGEFDQVSIIEKIHDDHFEQQQSCWLMELINCGQRGEVDQVSIVEKIDDGHIEQQQSCWLTELINCGQSSIFEKIDDVHIEQQQSCWLTELINCGNNHHEKSKQKVTIIVTDQIKDQEPATPPPTPSQVQTEPDTEKDNPAEKEPATINQPGKEQGNAAQKAEEWPQTRKNYRDNKGQHRQPGKYRGERRDDGKRRYKNHNNGEKRTYRPKYVEKEKSDIKEQQERQSSRSSDEEDRNFKKEYIKRLQDEGFSMIGKPKPKAPEQRQNYNRQQGKKYYSKLQKPQQK